MLNLALYFPKLVYGTIRVVIHGPSPSPVRFNLSGSEPGCPREPDRENRGTPAPRHYGKAKRWHKHK